MKEIGSAKVSYGSNAVNGPEHPVTGTSGDTESYLSELEPCAVKVARTVLRGGRSGQPASPTRLMLHAYRQSGMQRQHVHFLRYNAIAAIRDQELQELGAGSSDG